MTYYKTTLTIYSEYPGDSIELEDLAREATQGDAICTELRTEQAGELPDAAREFFALDD